MYTLERKLVSQLLFLVSTLTLVGAQASAITLSELRQVITDSQESVATAHLVYIKEFNDNRPTVGNKDTLQYKLKKISKHRRTRVDAILDYKTKRAKSLITDLRDVDVLLRENHLPAEQKINVSLSKALLHQGTYQMELTDSNVSNGPPDLGLFERPDPANYLFKMIYLGVINKKLLSEHLNPTLTEIDLDGKSLLRIQLTVNGQNAMKATIKIECDPSMGYRFRRIEWRSDGQLIKETIADNYRDVNDVNDVNDVKVAPYPFLYIDRSFDKDGKIRRETKYVIEHVNLGVNLSAKDLKVFVPDGTYLTDGVLSMTIHKVERAGYMGINDALGVGASWLLKHY